jgi:hypothetical protein
MILPSGDFERTAVDLSSGIEGRDASNVGSGIVSEEQAASLLMGTRKEDPQRDCARTPKSKLSSVGDMCRTLSAIDKRSVVCSLISSSAHPPWPIGTGSCC